MLHCVKSVQIRSFLWSVFPVFSPNTGKYIPENTPYLDTFYAVLVSSQQKVFSLTTRLVNVNQSDKTHNEVENQEDVLFQQNQTTKGAKEISTSRYYRYFLQKERCKQVLLYNR